jgi:ankyrin repeat protein
MQFMRNLKFFHKIAPRQRKFQADIEMVGRGIQVISVLILCIGMVITVNSDAQIKFNLKSPATYFENKQSIALLQAAMAGDLTKARELVAAGANPNEEGPTQDANANRLRLLHYAIASDNKQAVKILIAVGADPEMLAKHNGNAFLFAVMLNDVEMLGLLLDHRPIKLLSYDTMEDMLMESIVHRRPGCMALLLERGAPIDFRDSSEDTLLMTAISAENFELAEQLIRRGASVKVDTPSGVTPAYQVQRMLTRYTPYRYTHL